MKGLQRRKQIAVLKDEEYGERTRKRLQDMEREDSPRSLKAPPLPDSVLMNAFWEFDPGADFENAFPWHWNIAHQLMGGYQSVAADFQLQYGKTFRCYKVTMGKIAFMRFMGAYTQDQYTADYQNRDTPEWAKIFPEQNKLRGNWTIRIANESDCPIFSCAFQEFHLVYDTVLDGRSAFVYSGVEVGTEIPKHERVGFNSNNNSGFQSARDEKPTEMKALKDWIEAPVIDSATVEVIDEETALIEKQVIRRVSSIQETTNRALTLREIQDVRDTLMREIEQKEELQSALRLAAGRNTTSDTYIPYTSATTTGEWKYTTSNNTGD